MAKTVGVENYLEYSGSAFGFMSSICSDPANANSYEETGNNRRHCLCFTP